MPERTVRTRTVTLSLSSELRWTLHHVLLDRIDAESTVTGSSRVDPPPLEVFRAFETLDGGGTTFTVDELEAIRAVLSAYHHSPAWVVERPRIERLLHRVSGPIEAHDRETSDVQAALPSDLETE